MSVSILTFANLGKKRNQPTADILPVIDTFAESGALVQVICQIHKDFYFPQTISAVPWFIRYPIRFLERVFRVPIPRRFVETLFDTFAQVWLKPATVTFFHGGFFLPKTFRKAQNLKSITVDITRTAHLDRNAQIEREEMRRLGVDTYYGWRDQLSRASTHCNEFSYIIALSEFVKESYMRVGYPEEKIYLASPDIDTVRFTPASHPTERFRVVYAAYTTPLKGLHYLLDAWEQLSLTDAELVLVGGYGYMPEVVRRQYDARITRNPTVTWIESTTTPEVHFQSASVFVFPSLTEGFGRVTLEAMACGIPVITTENARGIVEDGKTGFVVPIRDANAIREKLEYLYQHQDVAQEMGREARRAVEAKKPFGEAVYEIYKDILKREGTV